MSWLNDVLRINSALNFKWPLEIKLFFLYCLTLSSWILLQTEGSNFVNAIWRDRFTVNFDCKQRAPLWKLINVIWAYNLSVPIVHSIKLLRLKERERPTKNKSTNRSSDWTSEKTAWAFVGRRVTSNLHFFYAHIT